MVFEHVSLRSALAGLALAVSLAFGAGAPAQAATMDFTIDVGASSVTLTDAANGFLCRRTNCGIEVDLVLASNTFTIGTGDTETFDFLEFTGTGSGSTTFNIAATLAFSAPEIFGVGGSGTGGAILLLGSIVSGVLTWADLPQTITLANGSTVDVNFQGGVSFFTGNSVTTTASITGVSIVPLPAGGLLLVSALGGLAALRRRKARAA